MAFAAAIPAILSVAQMANKQDQKQIAPVRSSRGTQVNPVQKTDGGLSGVLSMGSAAASMKGGGGSAANMGAVDRAIASQDQISQLQQANLSLRNQPEDIQQSLGPILSEALKRQSQPQGRINRGATGSF